MTNYSNAYVFAGGGFVYFGFAVENGRFAEPGPGPCVDLEGAYVIPGLVEIHSHGNSGYDFCDASLEGLETMARYYARNGITSFAPASVTLPYEVLGAAFETGRMFARSGHEGCARMAGIHMEGPFFSEKKKGAQNAEYLRLPDYGKFKELYDRSGGLIKIVDVAPELEGAADFTEQASKLCTVSVAHTDCSYGDAEAVYSAGARHLTHLFNAMPGIHHRSPGPIGAASENSSVTAELICDGQHVHESAVRMAFKLFPGRICLVSDSLRCAGMPDGEYELGGQKIWLKDSLARLEDGTIAGSASNLFQCMKNAIRFGIDASDAINAATINPARAIGMEDKIGSIEPGKLADFIVCDSELNIKSVYISGTGI